MTKVVAATVQITFVILSKAKDLNIINKDDIGYILQILRFIV